MLEIHSTARISSLADIEESTRGSRIVIGAGVVIDSFVKIKPVGGVGDVIIGPDCYLNSGTVIYSGNGVVLGSSVLVGPNCAIVPVNHQFRSSEQFIRDQGFATSRGGVRIGSDCWLGAGVVVLDGADIADGVVVGALSLVRGVLPPYSVCHGRPAIPVDARR